MKHVHIEVAYLDERGGVAGYCMCEYGSWHVDNKHTHSLIIGRKLKRVHIPLIAIEWFRPVEGPSWCKVLPKEEEELRGSDVDT